MVYDFTDSDRYYLRISNPGADVSSSSYAFSTTVVPVVDSFEPNDGYGDAKLLNQVNQIQGYLFKTGDQDWFRLEMAAP